MTAKVVYADVDVGTALPGQRFGVRRASLVAYAGASGDFNPIHWSERFAIAVGLPGVIAHGMFTMAEAVRVVTDWVGDPGAIIDYGVRFSRPVVVPDDDSGAELQVEASIVEKLPGNQVVVDLVTRCGGERVLGKARVTVQLG